MAREDKCTGNSEKQNLWLLIHDKQMLVSEINTFSFTNKL